MANFDRSRQVLEAYDNHLVTEREALEMVNLRSVSELRYALVQKAPMTTAGGDRTKTENAQVIADSC